MIRPLYLAGAAVVIAALVCVPADAKHLDPGQEYFNPGPSGVSLADHPELAGSTLADTTTPFNFEFFPGTGLFLSGNLRQMVVRETTAGTLDFYYRISITANNLEELRVRSLLGFSTDADYRTDLDAGTAPWIIQRLVNSDLSFGVNVATNTSSSFLMMRTDAEDYASTGSIFLSGPTFGGTVPNTFTPINVGGGQVPEPAGLLLAVAFTGFASLRRRR